MTTKTARSQMKKIGAVKAGVVYATPCGRVTITPSVRTSGGWGKPSHSMRWYEFRVDGYSVSVGHDATHGGLEKSAAMALKLAKHADDIVAAMEARDAIEWSDPTKLEALSRLSNLLDEIEHGGDAVSASRRPIVTKSDMRTRSTTGVWSHGDFVRLRSGGVVPVTAGLWLVSLGGFGTWSQGPLFLSDGTFVVVEAHGLRERFAALGFEPDDITAIRSDNGEPFDMYLEPLAEERSA